MKEQLVISKDEAKEYIRLKDDFESECLKMSKIYKDERKWMNIGLGYFVGFICTAIAFVAYGRILG